ncbi:MAG TPA: hypothetical protein ENH23_06395 [candidate division Zixibacteria bacterium]|nr:hypothetical protein [candidate division Zixibacteria bacterium]
MVLDFVPDRFSRFLEPIEAIVMREPASISVVGSYGNPNKKPTETSDLDLIFVFDVASIYRIYQSCLNDLCRIEKLKVVELGVHFQYGFVASIYYHDEPLCWVDIGIMDVTFAENYLVNLPKKDVFGIIQSSDIKQNPIQQMNHLARKILKSHDGTQTLSIDIACYRYLSWLKVYSEIQMNKNEYDADVLGIIDLFQTCKHEVKREDVIKLVFNDIGMRFSEIMEAVNT